MRPHALTVAIAVCAACGSGAESYRATDNRLNGEWEIVLTMSRARFGGPDRPDTVGVAGTVAFVPNRAGSEVPSFGRVPQQIGTHDLRLDRLVPGVSPRTTVPIAAGTSVGDSVHLVLDPGSGEPIVLRGTWQAAEVKGEWMAHHRAGFDQQGRFTLRRPPP